MSRAAVTLKLRKEDLSYLIDYLVGDLRVWGEKGFESREEEKQFQRLVSIVSRLREAIGEDTTLFI